MTIRRLDRADWGRYFDNISRALGTKDVTIEVAPLGIGPQMEAKTLALRGLVYDRKSDVFEIQTASLDHMISQPTEIWVDESADEITSVEVVDKEGTKQIVILSEPLQI
jgi:hypothetical protein